MENVKSLNLDNLNIEVTTNCEHGLLHLQVRDPFEKTVGEMISPIEIRNLIAFLEDSLKVHEANEDN